MSKNEGPDSIGCIQRQHRDGCGKPRVLRRNRKDAGVSAREKRCLRIVQDDLDLGVKVPLKAFDNHEIRGS